MFENERSVEPVEAERLGKSSVDIFFPHPVRYIIDFFQSCSGNNRDQFHGAGGRVIGGVA
jgi:hypothetical protein